MPTPQEDLYARFAPSRPQVEQAKLLLQANPQAEYAFVVIVLPGKEHGTWEIGQAVEPVQGVVLLAVDGRDNRDGLLSYSRARDLAEDVGKAALAGRDGTYGYARVDRDGNWAVFEGF